MSDKRIRFAYCRLVLRGEHWMPIGLNTKMSAAHRVSPDGPVVTAFVTALVDEDRIVGWPEKNNSRPFSIEKVLPDGSVEEDASYRAMAAYVAEDTDNAMEMEGVIGIGGRLAMRKLDAELDIIPDHLRKSVFDRAAFQILDRLHGKKAAGVMFSDWLEQRGDA